MSAALVFAGVRRARTRARPAPSILFIRSVPVPVARAVLPAIRRSYPDAAIAVLTSPGSVAAMEQIGVADRILPYRSARFGLLAAGPTVIGRLRAERFDAVVVPFVGASRGASWNVARFAAVLGGRASLWLPCDGAGERVALEACDPVSLRPWIRQSLRSEGLRRALLAAIKPPALILFSVAAITALALLAMVLLPLVWLQPGSPAHEP